MKWIFIKSAGSAYSNAYSMLFDGVDEYVAVPKNTAMDFERTSTFSVRFWIKTTGSGFQGILGNGVNSAFATGLTIYASGGTLGLYLMADYGSGFGSHIQATGQIAINDGTWKHVVITYSGSSIWTGLQFYVGDTQDTLLNLDPGVGNLTKSTISTREWRIGNPGFHYNGAGLAGNLDEVIFYDSVLTQSQVTALFDAEVDPSTLDSYTNAISPYRMGDLTDSITTIFDQKGSNNGTPTNMESGDIVADVPA